MPLTPKGQKIMAGMVKTYGSKDAAERVFYASKNKGTISGVEAREALLRRFRESLSRRHQRGRG